MELESRMELDNRTAVVTGAAQGMGKVFAEKLAKAGANVAICDVNDDALDKAGAEIESKGYGGRILARRVDVSSAAEVEEFVAAVVDELSGVDILVNNAAIHPLHPVESITSEEWDRVLAVNLKGFFHLAKAVLPAMRRKRFGRIINIASEAGKNGGTVAGLHYASSKGAVLSFTRNLAKQVGADGITVNAIAPGRIATPMAMAVSDEENQVFIDKSVVKRLGKPEDIARGILFLASPDAGFITGETLNINGGTLMD